MASTYESQKYNRSTDITLSQGFFKFERQLFGHYTLFYTANIMMFLAFRFKKVVLAEEEMVSESRHY